MLSQPVQLYQGDYAQVSNLVLYAQSPSTFIIRMKHTLSVYNED